MPDLRVLYVEDDALCALETCETLKEYGYNVLEAHRADDALLVIESRVQLCALVTDVDLGPGADGFDIARAARGAYPRLPVVFISGTAESRHLAEGVDGSEFIAKPFQSNQILAALERAIRLEAA
jgi:CheY-like chemotaxis protein